MSGPRLAFQLAFALVTILCLKPLSVAQMSQTRRPMTAVPARGELLDINSASKAQLESLPAIGIAFSQTIIDGRPYKRKEELLSRKIVPETTYYRIEYAITAKKPKK